MNRLIKSITAIKNRSTLIRILVISILIIISIYTASCIYNSVFSISKEIEDLSVAITTFNSHPELIITQTEIIEFIDIENILVVFHRDKLHSHLYGFALLEKGLNNKYRLISTKYTDTGISSVVHVFVLDYKELQYYLVGGYNVDCAIRYYSLEFLEVSSMKDIRRVNLNFEINGEQFLEIHKSTFIDNEVAVKYGDGNYSLYDQEVSLLDKNENDITENYLIDGIDRGSLAGGGVAEGIASTYFKILFVWGITYIYIRYGLLEPYRDKSV